jgi:hypothetical protein
VGTRAGEEQKPVCFLAYAVARLRIVARLDERRKLLLLGSALILAPVGPFLYRRPLAATSRRYAALV